MTVSPEVAVPAAAPTAEMASRVARLRSRTTGGDMDRALLLVGGTLLPLGVLVIVLGWLGASRTVLLFEQIPYLVSGGFLGLALVFVGGFVYFAYWQTLQVREARAHHEHLIASLARIEVLLGGGAATAAASTRLVATARGTMVHRHDCEVVAGRSGLREVAAFAKGFEPCQICQPY
ncbi:MAG: hypothetical protein ACYDH6_21805 [Acidimicrobiales bacterium]